MRLRSFVRWLSLPLCLSLTACQSSWAQRVGSSSVNAEMPLVALKAGERQETIVLRKTFGTSERSVWLHVPPSYRANRAMPLVIGFHGYGGTGQRLAQSSGLSTLADRQGFIAVFPDGIDRAWDVSGSEDVALTTALIAQLQKRGAIDDRRIYAMGISNGGFLVQRLACVMPNRFAALATVVATMPQGLAQQCGSAGPVSMLMINGTDDQKVPWTGGSRRFGSIVSVPDSIAFWRQHNGCSGETDVQTVNARVQIDRTRSCRSGAEVELVTLKGVGHLFPRGGGGPNGLIDGSQEIWQFFQRHER